MLGSTLILLATIGQLASGEGSQQYHPAATQARQWVDVLNPETGQPIRIAGWIGADGRPRFNPLEYPALAAAIEAAGRPTTAPPPTPDPGPVPGKVGQGSYPINGVVQSKIPAISAGQVWRGGNVIEEAGPGAEGRDKGGKPDVYLTVIGSKEERARMRTRLASDPTFAAVRSTMGERLAVHDYPPGNPMVAKVGLPDGGKPDVVIQDASGGEARRWHEAPDPAEVVKEVRKLDPSYRPGGHGKEEGEPPNVLLYVLVPAGATVFTLAMYFLITRGGRWNSRS